jgi:hypothetical protein
MNALTLGAARGDLLVHAGQDGVRQRDGDTSHTLIIFPEQDDSDAAGHPGCPAAAATPQR